MDSEKDPKIYIKKIVDDINFCIERTKNINLDDFIDDELLSSAISFKFVQISENSKKIPESLYETYNNIPWKKISGLRNRIVHDYGSVQLDIIYNTIKNDLPTLYDSLLEIVK